MDVCFSGGAKGADLAWGVAAEKAGHQVVHFGFKEHKGKKTHIIENEFLSLADPFLIQANKTLHRQKFPRDSEYVNNLLRRNYWQIKDTERVYAIATIDFEKNVVNGGTGWAVQMAIDKYIPEIYVFDQNINDWCFPQYVSRIFWVRMSKSPPKPYGLYTGIGTRELTQNGQHAIEELYVNG